MCILLGICLCLFAPNSVSASSSKNSYQYKKDHYKRSKKYKSSKHKSSSYKKKNHKNHSKRHKLSKEDLHKLKEKHHKLKEWRKHWHGTKHTRPLLVGHWKLDEGKGSSAYDSSLFKQHAKLKKAQWITDEELCLSEKCMSFDGNNAHLRVNKFKVRNKTMSVSTWIKSDDFCHNSSCQRDIISSYAKKKKSLQFWTLKTVQKKGKTFLKFRYRSKKNNVKFVASQVALEPGTWTHVAMVYTGKTIKLFQNGKLAGEHVLKQRISFAQSSRLFIGGIPRKKKNKSFFGLMDEVKIFRYPLTDEEVSLLADELSPPVPVCGDGVIDGEEQCDGTEGVGEHQECSEECVLIDLPYCGDGVVNNGELCDGTSGVGEHQECSEECALINLPYCGDGVVNTGELCDGTSGVGENQECSDECTLINLLFCGDGNINNNEQCDGQAGVGVNQTCDSNCNIVNLPFCGDGVHNSFEECDGTEGVGEHQECSDQCLLIDLPFCGDGLLNGDEPCDGDLGIGDHQECSSDCQLINLPFCGDGVVNNTEECDGTDGVGEHQDCSDECSLIELLFCGDGVVNNDEQCDGTAGVGEHQECSDQCLLIDLPFCGDGLLNSDEECEGTLGVGEHQVCSDQCTLVALPYCGDGIQNNNEQCDGTDGVGENQECLADCTLNNLPFCGDGVINNNEECDGTAGVGENQQCSEQCVLVALPYCGDGIVNNSEQCDGVAGVGEHQECSDQCVLIDLPYCGDGICQQNDENINTCAMDCIVEFENMYTHFRLDENYSTTSLIDDGYGHNHAYASTSTSLLSQPGVNQQSLELNNSSEYINVDNFLSDIKYDAVGSISIWVKRNNDNKTGMIFGFTSDFDTSLNLVVAASGRTNFIVQGFANNAPTRPLGIFYDDLVGVNEWTHLVCVQDGNNFKMYKNGIFQPPTGYYSNSDSGAWFKHLSDQNPQNLTKGRLGITYIEGVNKINFDGRIDDFRYYDNPLSDQAILDIYNNVSIPQNDVCGNGLVENAEECDGNETLSCSINGYEGAKDCQTDCTYSACSALESCGDSIIQSAANEECDDGNTVSNDGCSDNCQTENCGDGVVQSLLGEECDDFNQISGDGCNASCLDEFCGDGIVTVDLNEVCDSETESCFTLAGYQGSRNCLNDCSAFETCQTALFCGDGVCSQSVENKNNCAVDCPFMCGDGILEVGEDCDDGNLLPEDGCSSECRLEFCGDGIIQTGLNETCDDNNTADNDGCSSLCQLEECTITSEMWVTQQLTNNTMNKTNWAIDNGQAVWEATVLGDNEDSEIFYYDGNNILQLTQNNSNDTLAQLSNSAIIWQAYPDLNNDASEADLYYYNFQTVTRLTNDNNSDSLSFLNGNTAIWLKNVVGNQFDMYQYDGNSTSLINSETNITSPLATSSGVIYATTTTPQQIRLYDYSNFFTLGKGTITNNQQIDDAKAVFRNTDQQPFEVFLHDITTASTTQITNNEVSDTFDQPVVHNDYIAWISREGLKDNLKLYDGINITTIATGFDGDNISTPSFGENFLVWQMQEEMNGDTEIFVYDLNTQVTTPITQNDLADQNPQASGQSIIWGQYTGSQMHLFMARYQTNCDTENNFVCGDQTCSTPYETSISCPADCPTLCGNGIVELGEECDDLNTNSEDGCSSSCLLETCGDGILQTGIGEECDDGNTIADDGCSMICQSEACDPNDPYHVEQITIDSFDIRYDSLNASTNGLITWQARAPQSQHDQIFLFDGSNVNQITNDSTCNTAPHINTQGHIAWRSLINPEGEIYFYDGTNTTRITDNANYDDQIDLNDNDHIAWIGSKSGVLTNNWEVYTYQSNSISQITSNSLTNNSVKINNLNHLLWQDFKSNSDLELSYHDGSNTITLTSNDHHETGSVLANNNHAAWSEKDPINNIYNTYYYDGTTISQVTNDTEDDLHIVINDNQGMAWVKGHKQLSEIYYYNGVSVVQLTNNTLEDSHVDLDNNGKVVWQGFDGFDFEIFMYDGSTVVQLTNNSIDDEHPLLSGDKIYWRGNVNGVYNLFSIDLTAGSCN